MILSKRLRAEAERCRRLATTVNDPKAVAELERMAREYEEKASRAEHSESDDNENLG